MKMAVNEIQTIVHKVLDKKIPSISKQIEENYFIYKKYDYLKQQGFSSKETIEKLMNEFHKSESGIKRALRHIKELIDGF